MSKHIVQRAPRSGSHSMPLARANQLSRVVVGVDERHAVLLGEADVLVLAQLVFLLADGCSDCRKRSCSRCPTPASPPSPRPSTARSRNAAARASVHPAAKVWLVRSSQPCVAMSLRVPYDSHSAARPTFPHNLPIGAEKYHLQRGRKWSRAGALWEGSGSRQLEQLGPYPVEHACIVACLALPEQPGGRIPGAVITVEQPAIVRRPGQQDPGGTSKRAGEMRDAGIDVKSQDQGISPAPLCLRNRRVRR